MNYKLDYAGAPGDVTAFLLANGEVVAREEGLADRRAAEKWADKAARDHKVNNTPAATALHEVALTGTKTFTL